MIRWSQLLERGRKCLLSFFSFETVFVLYLFAGFYKADDRLAWIPVDLTLLFFVLSLSTGGWVLWRRGFATAPDSLGAVGAMALFAGWMLLSLLWAPPSRYGHEKAVRFAVLNGWALAGAALVIGGERRRLRRFFYAVLALALIFSLESLRIYLPHQDLRFYHVFGATYQTVGRVVGSGLVMAAGLFFDSDNERWTNGLLWVAELLFFLCSVAHRVARAIPLRRDSGSGYYHRCRWTNSSQVIVGNLVGHPLFVGFVVGRT